MRSGKVLALMAAAAGLAAASLPPTVQAVWEGGAEPKPEHKPKKGKPTKAEKKAAKRARTRGVDLPHGGNDGR